MSFSKITNTQLNSRGATTLPNQPTISASALKQEFDAPAKQIVAPAFNNLIDELEAVTSAASLGAVAPTGRTGATIQAVMNSISGDLATLETNAGTAIADAHTHSNKTLLDTYTQTEADLASAVSNNHTHSNKTLLDSYTQTETDIADAVSKKHAHSNQTLLDTYTQTETDLADAVSSKHTHSNKTLLDTYTQTETNLADAVTKKHAHSNGTLLDTYTQTETDLADAVSKKHAHSNKTVIDKFGEDSGGNPTYDGNPIGGGGTADAYKVIESAGQSFTASGADTFKINAGSNVTITALTGDKGILIAAAGGGSSTGDMLMSDYDSDGSVKTAGGIKSYVASQAYSLPTAAAGTLGGVKVGTNLSIDAAGVLSATDTTYSNATTTTAGLMSTTDKSKLDGIASGAEVNVNPDWNATSGKAEILNKPTIPAAQVSSDWNAISGVAQILNKPTKVSAFTNDSGYQTASDVSTAISGKANTSQLDGWTTASQVQSDGTVTFTGLNDNYGYDIFAEDVLASVSQMTKTGSGTNVTLVYKTDAPQGTNCKLRILK